MEAKPVQLALQKPVARALEGAVEDEPAVGVAVGVDGPNEVRCVLLLLFLQAYACATHWLLLNS